MWSGDHPGLQNRRTSVYPGVGAFDSHTLPPVIVKWLELSNRSGTFHGLPYGNHATPAPL